MKERRIAQKQLQKKAKKEMEEEKKKIEKRMDAAKTYQSWQVMNFIFTNESFQDIVFIHDVKYKTKIIFYHQQ